MSKSLLELAYDLVSTNGKPTKFKDIWDYCVKNAELSPEDAVDKMSRFYTNLTLDGRFVALSGNVWDLRVNHKYDSVHVDMSEFYQEDETSSGDSEEDQENAEYNAPFEEDKSDNDDDNSSEDSDEEGNEEDKF